MSYALIDNDAVTKYPYSFAQLRADRPQVSFPREASDDRLKSWGVFPVAPTARPSHNPLTQDVAEATPTRVDGVWTQAWAVQAASAAEVARRQKEAAEANASTEVKADAFVTAFLSMTPSELSAYVDANATTIAAMRALVKRMALMLLIVARRELR